MDDDRPQDEPTTESERLQSLPEHEDDEARGVSDSLGAGVVSSGGTAESRSDVTGQPAPDEGVEDESGVGGLPFEPTTRP